MIQLIFCNILIIYIIQIKNITLDNYKLNHPAGNIGKNLKTIKDILIYEYPKINITKNVIQIHDILLEMTKYSIGCCFFIKDNKLYGILTDGDIRRLLLNDDIKEISIEDINQNYNYEYDENKLIKYIKDVKRIKFFPVIIDQKIIGIISYKDIL